MNLAVQVPYTYVCVPALSDSATPCQNVQFGHVQQFLSLTLSSPCMDKRNITACVVCIYIYILSIDTYLFMVYIYICVCVTIYLIIYTGMNTHIFTNTAMQTYAEGQ